MFTVNLEKQLIKQNKKVLLPSELLSVKEYERLGDDVCESEVLSRVGLNRVVRFGRAKKDELNAINNKLSKFDQQRVFHLSQIEAICKKYHLRFLETQYFKGSVDAALASKISTFEVAYQQECNGSNCRIVAPVASFDLQERPKDPLFFYNLGNGYWYLVHKWGNDLSLFRRLYSLLSNGLVTWLVMCGIPAFLILSYGNPFGVTAGKLNFGLLGIIFVALCIYTGGSIIIWCVEGICVRLVKKNDWENAYK